MHSPFTEPGSIKPALGEDLHERGVHFVICRAKDEGERKAKSAIETRWQHQAATLDSVLKHRGLLGFIPGRSNLLVIDIDTFPTDDKDAGALVDRLGVTPLAVIRTPRGCHIYFKKSSDDGKIGNRAWALDGFAGDIRGDRGYVICWQPPELAAALGLLPAAESVSETLFPKPAKGAGLHLVEGNRNNTLNTLIYRKAQAGQTDFHLEREDAIASGLSETEVDRTIRSASEAATSRTFPRKDADALEGALGELRIEVRYNLRAMRAEFKTGANKWVKTSDRSSADLRRLIAEKFSYSGRQGPAALRFGKESWDEHLNALLYHREVDPFKVWLESLPEWDGNERLAKLLPDCLGAADGSLTRWAGFYLCLGAVQRTYEPGGLLREIPIIIGPQRAGKSQLLSNLLPPDQPDWFSDSLCVSEPTQKRVEAMLGRVIVELSELTGFRRAELESLKAFISRRDDGATRLSYRRDPETALRRCILVGTSNDSECLPNDPSGNSRFVPIQCGLGSHVEPYLDERREQLWAEGLAFYRKGERANLPRNLMELQGQHAETHRRKDQMAEDAVENIIEQGPFTLKEVCAKTFTDPKDTRAINRVCAALRLAGWRKRRGRTETGNLANLWYRSDDF